MAITIVVTLVNSSNTAADKLFVCILDVEDIREKRHSLIKRMIALQMVTFADCKAPDQNHVWVVFIFSIPEFNLRVLPENRPT